MQPLIITAGRTNFVFKSTTNPKFTSAEPKRSAAHKATGSHCLKSHVTQFAAWSLFFAMFAGMQFCASSLIISLIVKLKSQGFRFASSTTFCAATS